MIKKRKTNDIKSQSKVGILHKHEYSQVSKKKSYK